MPGAAITILLLVTWVTAIVVVSVATANLRQTDSKQLTEAIRIVAWPVVVCLALIVMRKPIGAFLTGISGRVNKLSAFKIELELSSVTAKQFQAPAIGEIKRGVRMDLNESAITAIFTQLRNEINADYIVIDLGDGDEWITSRLYIVAALFDRMRGVRCLLFLDGTGKDKGRFVGTANIQAVRWCLAHRYPWFEVALAEAMKYRFPDLAANQPAANVVLSTSAGAFEPGTADVIVKAFVGFVQDRPQPYEQNQGWIQINQTPETWERADWITSHTIRQLLGDKLNRASIPRVGSLKTDDILRNVLSRPGPFVAGLTGDKFDELFDRVTFVEEVAKQTAKAMESAKTETGGGQDD